MIRKEPITDTVLENQQHSVERLAYRWELERRDFLKVLGGGVVVCLSVGPMLAQESGGARRGSSSDELPRAIAAWLHFAEDGTVTVYTGKVELGQNIRTSLSQQVAEELRLSLSPVQLVMGDTDLTPFDMGTFGSRTTPTMGPQLRKAAASAREVLIQMAAARWQVDRTSLLAADGRVSDPHTGQSAAYSELVKGQQLTALIADDAKLTPSGEWRVAGIAAPKVNGRAFVTGAHKYTPDLNRAGMMHGKVLRPAAFHASLVTLDFGEAGKMAEVKIVRDGDFVGLVAPDEYTAAQAVAALRGEWKTSSQVSEAQLFDYLRKNPDGKERESDFQHIVGSVEKGFAGADKTFQQSYTLAYVAHTPLEPRAAVAEWDEGKLTVWTGTQRPFAVRDELAQAFHLPTERVRVIIPDTGSAYGGKHTGDAAVEAARLAKAAGKPVKLVWTREEEFTWAYFRPAGVIDVKSGINKEGKILAWEHQNYNSGPAAIRTPYDIPHQRIEFHSVDSPLRQGSYRGLAAPANHFARETHLDELAHLLGMDPLEFRIKNLSDPRLRTVFEAAARRFNWGKERSSSTRGFGIAGGVEKGSYVATCAEVAVDSSNGNVKIRRVVEAFECGAIVNPDGLRNQIEGCIVQAIGGALFEAIHFDGGKILNPHLAQYRVPRFSDLPEIEIELLDRKDLPSAGAGETPNAALAPAVGNAIFNATGVRLRSLPLVPHGLPRSQNAITGNPSHPA
jgi:isoquinoline 1-oxidoreductase